MERKERGLGEKFHVYGGGRCQAKREAKEDLVGSGLE